MKKRKRRIKRIVVSRPSTLTIERLAMAMEWAKTPAHERDYARNRARELLDKLESVIP